MPNAHEAAQKLNAVLDHISSVAHDPQQVLHAVNEAKQKVAEWANQQNNPQGQDQGQHQGQDQAAQNRTTGQTQTAGQDQQGRPIPR